MTLTVTNEKKKILSFAEKLLKQQHNIRTVSSFIGNLTASFEAIPHGRLFYRCMEMSKIDSLKKSRGDFESPCYLSDKALHEITWWRDNILDAVMHLRSIPYIDYTIFTDACGLGWGAHDNKNTINGRWTRDEQHLHINCLEFMAMQLAVNSFLPLQNDIQHLRIMTDNSTAISYVNKQGGTRSLLCHDIAVKI